MKNRHPTLPLALALALASPGAFALGLGQLQVKSGLNQPLVAEIPIISATPSELDQLDVRLASPEAFARVGLERPGDLTANLQFSVGKNARGQPVIRVSTPSRFSEPVLSFLIEAGWGKGTVTREYTALIDPPYIAPAIIQPMLTPAIAAVAPAPIAAPKPAMPMTRAAAPPPAPAPEPVRTMPVPEPAPSAVSETVEVAPVMPAPPPPPPEAPPAPKPQSKPRPQFIAAPKPPLPPAPVPAPARVPEPAPSAAPGQYGPVSPGQTLWSIANSVRPDPAISINQMMVALLRANPEAFDQDNVNRLKRGSVLRVPGQEEVNHLSAADAAALIRQQANAWRTPRQPVPQPVEGGSEPKAPTSVATAPKPPAPRVAKTAPRRSTPRLEIVPPSGNSRARGAQSGAAAGAGGSELRAELVQAREDLAARTSEVTELKSRVTDLEKQDSDRQRLIDMQNSQLKELQDRLRKMEAEKSAAPPAAVAGAPAVTVATPTPAASPEPATAASPPEAKPASPVAPPAAVAEPVAVEAPWYMNPFLLGGALLVVLGAMVLAMRRKRAVPETRDGGNGRLSEDDALRASMAKTRAAAEPIKPQAKPVLEVAKATAPVKGAALAAAAVTPVPASSAVPSDPELEALAQAVRSRPQDLEAHLSLLRLHHARGNAIAYEASAQAMRLQVPSTMDPRWREAVIMGSSLMPGHALFSQAGWNSPRYSDPEASRPAAEAASAEAKLAEAKAAEDKAAALVTAAAKPAPPIPAAAIAAAGAAPASVAATEKTPPTEEMFGGDFPTPPKDLHRHEAEMMLEDEPSSTRIELAKAYLDIGDLDGARGMLEEVLAEGGPAAKNEAARILKEIG